MSFTSVGSLGGANDKTSTHTITMSPTSNVPAGHLIYVSAAGDGDRGGDPDSVSCVDSVGNLYTTISCQTYDVIGAMFLAYVETPLTTSDTITVAFRPLSVAKAITAWEFTIGQGKRWAAWRDRLNENETTPGNVLNECAITSGLDSSVEYLILHSVGNKRPDTDTYTADADYTLVGQDGTTGGINDSNVTTTGSFRIVSGITDDRITTLCSSTVTNDAMQGMMAVSEVDYDGAFPTFPNFDNFNRADEDPLASPPWSITQDLGQGTALLRIVSNQCARSAIGSGNGAQKWATTIPPGDDGEVFVTLAVVGAAQAGVHCFASGTANSSTLGGYAIYWIPVSGSRADYLHYGDTGFNAGQITANGLRVWQDRANGYKMGLQMRNSGIEINLWVDTGTGWRWASGYYRTSFVSNGGDFGLNAVSDTAVRFDDFGGGTSIRFIPQIFRRLPVRRSLPP